MRDADRQDESSPGSPGLDFRVSSESANESTLVRVAGEVDLYAAPRLENELEGVIRSGAKRVIVDLTGVPFLDSSGLAVLLGAARKLGRGNLVLTGVQPQIARVLLTTGASWLLTIADNPGESAGEMGDPA